MERRHAIRIGAIILLVGTILLGYPFLSRYLYKKKQIEQMIQYQEQQEEIQENPQLNADKDSNVSEDIRWFLEIPAIEESLPIYESTEEADLRRGVGVLEGSDAPGKGEGHHCVICGHAGFAKASLFSNLRKLQIGDEFYLYLGKETLVYEVDQILVVKPEDQEALLPEDGKDYVTLLTCTPPGKNTHRLLVRGEKTK